MDLTTSDLPVDPAAVIALRDRVAGDVLTPDHDDYAATCQGFNLANVHRPALVVSATSTADVAAAVTFARTHGRSVAVQATGHGAVRPADGAVLVETSRMTGVRVDAGRRTAWISAGCQWAQVIEEAQQHGLAPLSGSSPLVGAVGYTLGGGMGWLARPYGLAVDRVRRFEVVTADGAVVQASATEHADLFWALRGAGAGNLGIVTGMEMELVEVTEVYAGNLLYPASMAAEVIARWHDWLAEVPDTLTSAVTLMNFPPFEEVPEPLRGQSFVIVRGCHVGDRQEAEQLLDHWRAWREPALDMFGPLPVSQMATISNDPVDPMPAMATGAWLDRLDTAAIDALVTGTYPSGGPPALIFAEIRHAGGAIARPPADSAVGNRDARLSLEMVGLVPTAEAAAGLAAHTTALKAALGECRTGGVYLNFVEGEEKRRAVVAGTGAEAAARLACVKAQVDPDDLFDRGLDLTGVAGA